MKAKNLKEFKVLISRYETITLEEIETKDISTARYELTGFSENCLLCKNTDCTKCVYGSWVSCFIGKNRKTFEGISNANTPVELLNAYRARAKHMKTLLK